MVTAQTASYVLNAVSSSFALTASFVNPLNQAVNISGSLNLTGSIAITGSTTTDLVRITQTGTGNAFVVEDSTNPDSSPFVISSSGNVGIGTSAPSRLLSVNGVFGVQFNDATESFAVNPTSTGVDFVIKNGSNPSLGEFRVDTRIGQRAAYYNGGNFTIGSTADDGINKLQVIGSARITNGLVVTSSLTVKGTGAVGAVLDTDTSSDFQSTRLFFKMSGSGNDVSMRNLSGSLLVSTQATAGVSSGTTTAMFISSSGNVAIGNTQPTLGNLQVLGNVYATSFTGSLFGSVIGNLTGTASYSTNAATASFVTTAQTASYFFTSSVTSASFATSASRAVTASYFFTASVTSASFATNAISAVSASNVYINYGINIDTEYPILFSITSGSYASIFTDTNILYNTFRDRLTVTNISSSAITSSLFGTASWANNAITASYVVTAQTASYFLTSSVTSASFAQTASYFFTQSVASSSLAQTASYVVLSQTASYVLNSVSSSYSQTASYFFTSSVTSASFAINSATASYFLTGSVTSASFAQTASSVNILNQNVSITGSLNVSSSITASVFVTKEALITSTTLTANTGITTIYSIPTASYDGAWFDYTIRSGSNARAGTIFGLWSSSAVNYAETTTTDFGSTANFIFGMSINGSNMILSSSTTTNGWTVNSIIRGV